MSSSTPSAANGSQDAYADLEKGNSQRLARFITPGGHPADSSQPAIPVQHVSPIEAWDFGQLTSVCQL